MIFRFSKIQTAIIRLFSFVRTVFLKFLKNVFGNNIFNKTLANTKYLLSLQIIFVNMDVIRRYKRYLFGFIVMILSAVAASAGNSVLSGGTWYKMSLTTTGMYRITYSDLESMGVDVDNIDPRNIQLYHNGGGKLPQINKVPYYDDLVQIPVFVQGEDDGKFNKGDYIVFYARGPVVWKYYSVRDYYSHVKNPYTDETFVFLTIGAEPGKRVQKAAEITGIASAITDYVDYKFIDKDEININNMGCTWYFDPFDVTTQREYTFNFNNLKTSKLVRMRSSIASRNSNVATFTFRYDGDLLCTRQFNAYTDHVYARYDSMVYANFYAKDNNITINLRYTKPVATSVGWLDFVELNATCDLKMNGDMMSFRNPEVRDAEKVYELQLGNVSNAVQVWDVTNPVEPVMVNGEAAGSQLAFRVRGDINNEFIAFNGNSYYSPTFVENVANQNLHANKDIDYLIITNPKFQSQAERLKEIHSRLDDLVIDIVQPQIIYNEFSCGAQDVAAIRNYIKMLYKNSSDEHRLKYVLLLGDASFDYKNPDVCLMPSWESTNACTLSSTVTDDFFVCLDDDEGGMENSTSVIDLAIGRMPVNTEEQANDVMDKIESYISGDPEVMNTWRNTVTLMCDDANYGEFIKNSELIADSLPIYGADVIVDKIYLDAYNQVATASGQRCPEMNEAITNRIEKGTLVINYNGHGGEIGLGDERFLTMQDINSWTNQKMLPLFVTATCEFSRYDDHTRTSAGETVYTLKRGGAIAMITTARVTGGSQGILLRIFRNMFKMYGGEYSRFGDIFLKGKQDKSNYTKVFVLFGDPALRLAYPKNYVALTHINGKPVISHNDTLRSLSTVELRGEVRNNFGEVMTDFNGIVNVTLYDKENVYQTKGDETSPVMSFKLRNSLLFKGKAMVENGRFEIRFVMPKDINYSYGEGLISFYATDYVTDANGSFSKIVVGGFDSTALPDVDCPEAKIFIDDTLFVNGGVTNENPVLYAYVRDKNGINMTGAGIGHDITATLSGATNKYYDLNAYYDSPFDPEDYGSIVYRMYGLNEGDHQLTFRVWDIYNNSTTVTLDFTVVKSNNLVVQKAYNSPNPMSSYTNFYFEHNQKGEMDILIDIYNISGQRVKTINESRYGTDTRIDPICWDGTADNGQPLPAGIYIYNVSVTINKKEKSTSYSKLVIAR